MPNLTDESVPHFAAGCRWSGSDKQPIVLFPEGAIRIAATGLQVLQLCDGQRSVGEIIGQLQVQYKASSAEKIRADVIHFLKQLNDKRIVDF